MWGSKLHWSLLTALSNKSLRLWPQLSCLVLRPEQSGFEENTPSTSTVHNAACLAFSTTARSVLIASSNLHHPELGWECHILQMGKLRHGAKLCLVKCYKAMFAVQLVVCGQSFVNASLPCVGLLLTYTLRPAEDQPMPKSVLSLHHLRTVAVDLVFLTSHSSYW